MFRGSCTAAAGGGRVWGVWVSEHQAGFRQAMLAADLAVHGVLSRAGRRGGGQTRP
jgi:hypothetical protein